MPLKPLSSSECIGQLAQFFAVQGIVDLNTTVAGFNNALTGDQVLRGASLVGHWVLIRSDQVALAGSGDATGVVMAPEAGSVTLEIADASGVIVRKLTLAADAEGAMPFVWDGLNAKRDQMPTGAYSIKATHTASSDTATALETYVDATVESVTIGSDGLCLNLLGIGTAPIDDVLRIGKSAS